MIMTYDAVMRIAIFIESNENIFDKLFCADGCYFYNWIGMILNNAKVFISKKNETMEPFITTIVFLHLPYTIQYCYFNAIPLIYRYRTKEDK